MRAPASSLPSPLAVTMGDPAGIGGEIALRAWNLRSGDTPPFFVIDDAARLTDIAGRFGIKCPVVPIGAPGEATAVFARALPVMKPEVALARPAALGTPDPGNAAAVVGAIDHAVALVKS